MKKHIRRLSALLLVLAMLLSLLSLSAVAAKPATFSLSGVTKVRYTQGERGMTFTDKETIAQVVSLINGCGPVKAQINPVSAPYPSLTVYGKDWVSVYTVPVLPKSGSCYAVFTDQGSYETKTDLSKLVNLLYDKMEETDPNGCFTLNPDRKNQNVILNNQTHQAVYMNSAEIEKDYELFEHLNNLQASKLKPEYRSSLGKLRAEPSELRLTTWDGDSSFSYVLYEKGIAVTRFTEDGGVYNEYYLCDTDELGALAAQLKQVYQEEPQKNAAWLSIINSQRVTETLLTIPSEGIKEQCMGAYGQQIYGGLNVLTSGSEAPKELTALWKTPQLECRVSFITDIYYRIQLNGNKLRIFASDMSKVLEYTVDKDEGAAFLKTALQDAAQAKQQESEKPNPNTAKPVIYLYPEQTTKVNVKLDFDGTLTSTYPTYPAQGWTVTAAPDGTLTDSAGRSYRYLFWEGVADVDWQQPSGFLVKGEDALAFLEEKLTALGLNELEQNDFITYWLPKLEQNGESFVSFAAQQYTDAAKLTVTPQPDSVLRVQMLMTRVDESNRTDFAARPEQQLPSFEREGFVLVEWGGTMLG